VDVKNCSSALKLPEENKSMSSDTPANQQDGMAYDHNLEVVNEHQPLNSSGPVGGRDQHKGLLKEEEK
jgi:hypothetical protein